MLLPHAAVQLCMQVAVHQPEQQHRCCKGTQEKRSKGCRQAGANKADNCSGATAGSTGSSTRLEDWPASEVWHRLAGSQALVRLLSK